MGSFAKAITDASDGFDVFTHISELAAQRLDVHVDGALQDDGVADGRVHEIVPRESAAGLLHQRFQEAKLGGRKRDRLILNRDAVRALVNANVRRFDQVAGRLRLRLAIQQDFDGSLVEKLCWSVRMQLAVTTLLAGTTFTNKRPEHPTERPMMPVRRSQSRKVQLCIAERIRASLPDS